MDKTNTKSDWNSLRKVVADCHYGPGKTRRISVLHGTLALKLRALVLLVSAGPAVHAALSKCEWQGCGAEAPSARRQWL